MKVTYKDIEQSIKKHKPYPVYFLFGDESFFIDKIVKQLEEELLDEAQKSFNQTVLYGKDIDFKVVLDHAKRFPVFAERQVVVIKEAQELKGIENLEKYFENPVPSTVLVLAHKHKKPDGRKGYFKQINTTDKCPSVACYESQAIKDSKLPEWIEGQLLDRKMSYSPEVPHLLCDFLGNDLSKIQNELDKLQLLNKPLDQTLLREQVGQSKEFNAFELQDAIGARNAERVLFIATQMAGNLRSNPLIVLSGLLSSFFGRLWVVKSMGGRQAVEAEVIQNLGLKGSPFGMKFVVDNLKKFSANYKLEEIEAIIHWLKIYDLRSKGINTLEPGGEEGDATPHEALLMELMHLILHPL